MRIDKLKRAASQAKCQKATAPTPGSTVANSAKTKCHTCQDRGMIEVGNAVRYCMCELGWAKKQEWIGRPAKDRARFESEVHTLPDEIEGPTNKLATGTLVTAAASTPQTIKGAL